MYKLEKVILQLLVIHSHWIQIRLPFLRQCNCKLKNVLSVKMYKNHKQFNLILKHMYIMAPYNTSAKLSNCHDKPSSFSFSLYLFLLYSLSCNDLRSANYLIKLCVCIHLIKQKFIMYKNQHFHNLHNIQKYPSKHGPSKPRPGI